MEPTRATLFLRLNADGSEREQAWRTFCERYEPVIAGFARSVGLNASEIPEIVQEVVAAFYAAQPSFAYDPARGRFRGYLKTCVINAINARRRRAAREAVLSDSASARTVPPDEAWEREWDRHCLNQAIERVRADYADNSTFRAFEAVVLRGQDPGTIAQDLGISRDSVYQAKVRVLARLRVRLSQIEVEMDH